MAPTLPQTERQARPLTSLMWGVRPDASWCGVFASLCNIVYDFAKEGFVIEIVTW
jgi:hypothetical protein